MQNVSKKEAVLLGLLCRLKGEVGRTKFVKLVYLLDNLHFEQWGTSLTDLTYQWYHYGPNAVDNEITDTLSELREQGFVKSRQTFTPDGGPAYYYRCAEPTDIGKLPLDAADWNSINSIVKRFGHLSRADVVKESKRTAPMQGITQYEVLNFKQNPRVEELKKRFFNDSEFVKDTMAGLSGPRKTTIELDELRAQVAQ